MQAHVSGQAGVSAPAPTLHVGPARRALLRIIIGSPLFSDAEQLRTNHNAHECADPVRLALWTRNALRERDRRQAQAEAAEHAEGLALLAAGIARFEAKLSAKQAAEQTPAPSVEQPTAAESTAPAPSAEPPTAAQLAELRRLAASPCLTEAERRIARHALRVATATEARAVLAQLRDLASTPRLRLTAPVEVGGRAVVVWLPERHYEAAKVDYVRDADTGRVLPRYQTYGGPLVQRVWAN